MRKGAAEKCRENTPSPHLDVVSLPWVLGCLMLFYTADPGRRRAERRPEHRERPAECLQAGPHPSRPHASETVPPEAGPRAPCVLPIAVLVVVDRLVDDDHNDADHHGAAACPTGSP